MEFAMKIARITLQPNLHVRELVRRSTLVHAGLPMIRGHRQSILVLALSASGLLTNAAGQSLAQKVGFYHWGGRNTTSVSQGVEQIAALGGNIARITLSPRHYIDYNLGGGCYPNFSLSAIVQEPDVKKALDNEQIEVFMLTAYDGMAFGDCI